MAKNFSNHWTSLWFGWLWAYVYLIAPIHREQEEKQDARVRDEACGRNLVPHSGLHRARPTTEQLELPMWKDLVGGSPGRLATADLQFFSVTARGGHEEFGLAASGYYFVFGRSCNLHLLQFVLSMDN